jgi:predicted HAD superfamily Cof-like phosphohydrolase
MSENWVKDIHELHQKFGLQEWMIKELETARNEGNYDLLRKYIAFRLLMIYEELGETLSAALVQNNSEEMVDGLIDLCVFAIGSLDVFGVDSYRAWDEVLSANLQKEPGIKEGRPNPFGLPDMLKPLLWSPPSHLDNHGCLPEILTGENNEV